MASRGQMGKSKILVLEVIYLRSYVYFLRNLKIHGHTLVTHHIKKWSLSERYPVHNHGAIYWTQNSVFEKKNPFEVSQNQIFSVPHFGTDFTPWGKNNQIWLCGRPPLASIYHSFECSLDVSIPYHVYRIWGMSAEIGFYAKKKLSQGTWIRLGRKINSFNRFLRYFTHNWESFDPYLRQFSFFGDFLALPYGARSKIRFLGFASSWNPILKEEIAPQQPPYIHQENRPKSIFRP